MWTGIIIGVIVVILIILLICSYNKLVRLRTVTEEAFSTMDVYLKKRFDLIPNLVETVKGYAAHEKETFEKIVGLRNANYSSMTPEEKMESSQVISRSIPKIMALAENYPDLKASENFNQLMAQLERTEEDIANSRKYYNGAVKQYNIAVQTIPTNIIAGMFGFQTKQMFEVADANERENVKVSF